MSEAVTAEASFPSNPASTEPRTPSPRYQGDTNEALEGGTEALSPRNRPNAPGCGHCIHLLAAYDRHRPNGRCLSPIDAGLVVLPRVRLTWSIPVKVAVAFDMFGEADRVDRLRS